MTETDFDTQAETDLAGQETQARLPWESIDPEEAPTPYQSPFASTATIAVEAGKGGSAVSPLLLNEFSVLENETASAVSADEREEQLADRAFFSDEKISIEMLDSAYPGDDLPATLLPQAGRASIRDPFSGTACRAILSREQVETAGKENAPQAGPLNEIAKSEIAPHASSIDAESVEFTYPSEEPSATRPANELIAPIMTDDDSVLVSRTLPADAVHEASITFSTADSLAAAASELAALAESFDREVAEEPADQTFLLSVSVDESLGGLADAVPELAVQPQPGIETEVDLEPELDAPAVNTGGGWTIPLMCLGIGLIACCMVIPQGESNRRLRYEQAALAADLQQVQKQVSVNGEFLKKVMDDPTLAERLAGRQMKTIRKGQKVVELKHAVDDGDMSPFSLVNVARPADLPPYKPKAGTIANLCNDGRSRLFLLGAALGMVAVGLVMGFGKETCADNARLD